MNCMTSDLDAAAAIQYVLLLVPLSLSVWLSKSFVNTKKNQKQT